MGEQADGDRPQEEPAMRLLGELGRCHRQALSPRQVELPGALD